MSVVGAIIFIAGLAEAFFFFFDAVFVSEKTFITILRFLIIWSVFRKTKNIVRIQKDNYKLFEMLHSQTDDDMYWNCKRIYDDLDNWVVFIKEKDGKPQGAIYYVDAANGWFEIFGIDIDRGIYDAEVFKELLQAALSDAKHRKGNVMTFFCDEEYEKVAKECGLECIGNYLCYKTHLN